MKFNLLPIYQDIFKGEPIPDKNDLLKLIPTDAIIRACCHINAELFNANTPLQKEIEMFLAMVEKIKDEDQKKVIKENLSNFVKSNGSLVGIFPVVHVLKLIEESFLNFIGGSTKEITPEQQLGVLKLLLIYNHEANEKLKNNLRNVVEGSEKMYQLFWTSLLPTSSFLHKKSYVISMYKALKFFKYLESKYPEFLKNYLKICEVDNPVLIILKLFEINANGYNKDTQRYGSYFNKGRLDNNFVVNEFTLDIINESREDYIKRGFNKNLKGLRSYPFLKYENGDIGITNWNFVIEKFYDGLVFDFYNKSGLKDKETFDLYKKKIGEDFSNPFFMDIMKSTFSKDSVITFKEGERNENCNYDFYIRIRNHVFLFEFKDVLFPLNETYKEIKTVVDSRLLEDKGVTQLIKQIKKLAESPKIFDEFEALDKLFIYPILVYTDSSFGMTGINYYLNSYFVNHLPTEVKNKFFYVNPFTMIPFDFFLENLDGFKKGDIDLVGVLNSYFQLKELNYDCHKKNPTTNSFLRLFDGFDAVTWKKYPNSAKKTITGEIYNSVLDEIRPYLKQ